MKLHFSQCFWIIIRQSDVPIIPRPHHPRTTIISVQNSLEILQNLTFSDIIITLHNYTYNGVSIVICHKVYAT